MCGCPSPVRWFYYFLSQAKVKTYCLLPKTVGPWFCIYIYLDRFDIGLVNR